MKETKYKVISFSLGTTIDNAVKELLTWKRLGVPTKGKFNDHWLYSDKDDLESAYKKVLGQTKAEVDEEERKREEKYTEEKRKHKEAIPTLTAEWIEKGKEILSEKYLEDWKRCVPIRLLDLYQGAELKCCLDIVKELNAGCELEKAHGIFKSQGHSGMSSGLVLSMLKSFCDRGIEYVDWLSRNNL